MTIAAPIIGVRCHYCSRHYLPSEIRIIGESVAMCLKCWDKHLAALEAFARGGVPSECGECHTPAKTLGEREPGTQVSFFLHHKDGAYQFLCRACDVKYVQQRRDLYGDTRFGWERKLR